MIIILNILENNQAQWLLIDRNKIKNSYNFTITKEKGVLFHLDQFLKKNKLDLKNTTAIALAVRQISLTQIKIITAVINTLGWQLNIPVVGEFECLQPIEKILPGLLKNLEKQKKFQPIKVVYKNQPEITISSKKRKFVIKK
ncbi:MAG: hypothetical protein COV55_00565 [Candidatus Komeilibacteria bacterium CG11_big_fil_rev_8_21_14_0_20_36_20]|uniref:Uncharacterized protein n=1 Tax=Candidatus Komeilibacteria bacterium CG11_big_fil_rev_8_21_14_0_20_36_20 TaxID=1974477 RepID=A0A2H0NEA3_9BACT|nr:MAG: hypothetical protein COV55_00565 [Candidatus Komeilibacteria bacterium CG11_big_fil_rev_8_21_14_0_20_36_20]PIR81676.1 MAG: hypothetical protein COU21_02420 [Candidatus Komeilibacteria bacterium CG10_big_fil_rev_8_21_14_0_10_36_65]PJC55607.1 MAG: hypothetical protein CO027_01230 [Candidatus Komeilibacteria bacterium CG_4_9_14_0_2_um_filter_36_13]